MNGPLPHGTVSIQRRILFATLVGLMLFLAFVHVVILRHAVKQCAGSGRGNERGTGASKRRS
jgi:hypothetical protein